MARWSGHCATLAIYRQPTLKRESSYQFCQLSELFEEGTIHGRFNMPPTPRPSLALESLPPRPKPSGSTAGITIQESTYNPLPALRYLPPDAPNIIIVLIDDAGPALPDTYGGEIHTPALSRVANQGISYNRFHTTAMCSPTRASLLTGGNCH